MKLTYVILYVEDVNRSVNFYKNAFSLEHKFTHDGGDYAEMITGETTLAFSNYKLMSDLLKTEIGKSKPITQITFTPKSIDESYAKALENGAKKLLEPVTKPWGFRVAMLEDLDGHVIELAREI